MRAGEAPEIEALQAEADVARAAGEVEVAHARLLVLMGLPVPDVPLVAVGMSLPRVAVPSEQKLLTEALTVRPDLLAAGIAVEAAAEQLRLAKKQGFTLDAIFDANSRGDKGFESGPGLRFTVPIFNRNKGGIAIAEARFEQASRRYGSAKNCRRDDRSGIHRGLSRRAATG